MFPRRRRRWRWLALVGVVCVVAGGAAVAFLTTSQPGDVSNPDVEFTDTQATEPTSTQREPKATEHPMDDGFAWPEFGYNKPRTRYLPLKVPLRPPFVTQWRVTGRELIEFPPVLCRRSLYMEKNNGALYKISRLTGRIRWKTKIGYLAASSPACAGNSVYAVVLARGKGIKGGRVIALDVKNGRVRWSRKLPSRAESSPLVASGRVYFGTEDGTVYALRARDGDVRWRYKADGAVKGGLALDRGRLFFGDYGGKVHAIRQRDGSPIWETSSAGSAFGLKAGRFYSTPAAAYGRVYIGSLDGFVYSFAASNGKLAWRHKTGNYVYSSPAVASVPGAGPTVYIGSYDGRLYAFDARSGRVRWTHNAGRQDLGRAGRRRRPRLLLEPLAALDGRGRRRDGQARVGDGARRLQPDHLRRQAPVLPGLLEPLHALLAAPGAPRRARPRPPGPRGRCRCRARQAQVPALPGPAGAHPQAQGRAPGGRAARRRAPQPAAAPPAPRGLLQEPRPHGLPHPTPARVRAAQERPDRLPSAQAVAPPSPRGGP